MTPALTISSEYLADENALLVQSWLKRIFEYSTLTGSTRALKCVLLGLYNGQRYPLDLQMLTAMQEEDFENALRLIHLSHNEGREPHSYFVRGPEIFSRTLPRFGESRGGYSASRP